MTWRRLAVPLVVVLAGCSATSSNASATQSPHAASEPRAIATPTGGGSHSPGPSPSAEPVVKLNVSCRLPVVTFRTGGDAVTYQGGFITFPAASYVEDPQGLIYNPYQQPVITTRQAPVLNGVLSFNATPFFDSAAGRWVPSGAGQASPDGSSYAYATAPDSEHIQIHVVDIRRGTEKTFAIALTPNVGAANGIEVEDYDGAGVYFVVTQVEQYPIGVWRLDLATGKVAALARINAVMAIRDGYAWAGTVDPHDLNPPRVPASRALFDSMARFNLTGGAQTPWYYTPGRSEFLLGMSSAGWPIVNVSDAPDYPPYGGEVRLLPEPHTDGESNGELVSTATTISNPETDGDRVWFGSDNGIYLYTTAGGLQKVFGFTPDPTTGKTMSPAGFCR